MSAPATAPRSAGDDFVRFVNVYNAFGPKQVARDFSLTVKRGEVLTLLGGSGGGKSVSLKLLIGLLTADAGRIEVDGVDVANFTEEQFLQGIRDETHLIVRTGTRYAYGAIRQTRTSFAKTEPST